MNSVIDQIIAKYHKREAVLGIIGMGYVGLPLMLAAAATGYRVVGFDVDLEKVDKINGGKSYFKHIDSHRIVAAKCEAGLRATIDFGEVKGIDAVIICVPTPLTPNREPDLTFVERTAASIAPHVQKDQLIVLEFHHLARHYAGDC